MVTGCLEKYLNSENYSGGLIGISTLSRFCGVQEGKLYVYLAGLQKEGKLKIVSRYYCPEVHFLKSSDLEGESDYFFCDECEQKYSNDDLVLAIYVHPLTEENDNKVDSKAI